VPSTHAKIRTALSQDFKNNPTTLDTGARAMTKANVTEPNDTELCLAKTRSGKPCQKHPIAGRTRCRLHGGLSTGPKTPEGKAACIAAHWKHGRRSKAYTETRKKIYADLRRVEQKLRNNGII